MVVTEIAGAPQPTKLLGRRIAGYVLDQVIGAGGMGAIYGATSRFVKKRAAVKVMLNEYTEDPAVVGRFLQEAFVASAVDHPNVVEIWAADRFEEDGRMYILMPLIEGSSLESLCENVGQLGFDTAATIAIQIAAGLDAVHELGVVHRDIKPANILLTKKHGLKHYVKIVDFGVARLLTPHLVGTSPERRTRTNMVIGTAGSMAPEQAAGSRDVDARADIYSWGVVLYRMLTGRPPYQGDSIWDLLERSRKGEAFPRPRTLRPDIPRAWEEVIMASLELYPNRRPSSMKEVGRHIAAALPSGDAMLATLAPNLIRDVRVGDSDKTLTGDLEDRWSMARVPARKAWTLPLAVALATGIGAAAGAVGVQLAQDRPAGAPERKSPEAVAVGPAVPDGAGAEKATNTPPRNAAGSGDAAAKLTRDPGPAAPVTPPVTASGTTAGAAPAAPAPAPTTGYGSAAVSVSAPTAPVSTPANGLGSAAAPVPAAPVPAPPAPVAAPAAGRSSASVSAPPAPASAPAAPSGSAAAPASSTPARPLPSTGSSAGAPPARSGVPGASSQVAQTGLIIVRSSPWAKVWIDDEALGQTAVRKVVKPGLHRIRLVGPDDQTKELTRNVKAGETVPIRWDW
jgi:eukaryotic-like serine/threonine-protein kinase